jgi:LuxR family maltose regulon positive regulatory protein
VGQESDNAYVVAWAQYLRAIAQLQSYRLEEALQGFMAAAPRCDIIHRRAAVDTLVGLALTYQARQRREDALDASDRLTVFARELNDPECDVVAESCRARLSLAQGDLAAAQRWAQAFDAEPHAPGMFFWLEIPLVTQARIRIASGSDAGLEKALAFLTSLQGRFAALHNTYQWIQVSILMAMAIQKQGRIDEALAILEEVLVVAGPQGWVCPFVELGPSMNPLLTRLADNGVAPDHIETLLAAFSQGQGDAMRSGVELEGQDRGESRAGTILLTQREAEIIGHVAEGLSNKEIAAKLFLSTETVKKHLYNAYQKLEVDSRVTALAKARALGILPRN